LLNSLVLVLMLRMVWLSASMITFLRRIMHLWLWLLGPHFWARIVSTSTYLINIKHFVALQGSIPLERLLIWGCSPDHRMLFVCLVGFATSSCPPPPLPIPPWTHQTDYLVCWVYFSWIQ
jgi:hypothetical protein